MMKHLLCLLLMLAAVPFEAAAAANLEPCALEGLKQPAVCGTLDVFENRESRSGRKIGLRVAVLRARSETPAPDPLFILQGGPGQSAIKLADFYAETFSRVLNDRDIVLVDQRGVGSSHPLNCSFADPSRGLQGYLGELFPVQGVRDCRKKLEADADLTQYTTAAAMDDLDDVRAWLGYETINLYGTSYGTYAAQVYMQRHANHLRSAVLKAVAPLNQLTMLKSAANSQQALDATIADCNADPVCGKSFPNLAAESKTLLERLDKEPGRASVPDPSTGKAVEILISRGDLAVTLRALLHSPSSCAKVPLMIHAAFDGNLGPLAQAALMIRKQLPGEISFGMFLSAICTEEIPLVDPAAVAAETAGTFTGSYWMDQLQQACKEWPRGKAPEPPKTRLADTPVLLISGGLDPVTPPRLAESAAALLPNSRHLVIPKGGHPFYGLAGCVDLIIADFYTKGSASGLDFSCAAKVQRPPFAPGL